MTNSRLNIIEQSDASNLKHKQKQSTLSARLKEIQAKFERSWLINPEQFNPYKDCIQKERLARIEALMNSTLDFSDKKAVDLGCGYGFLSRSMQLNGADVLAVDISENALKCVRQNNPNILTKQDALPVTKLADQSFDIVICTDVIAELFPQDYRLFFAELARIVKPNGYVICSTPIDIYSENGLERFMQLSQTEFMIVLTKESYHALYLKIKHLCKIPNQYVEGWLNLEIRSKELKSRKWLSKGWYQINTSFILIWFWLAAQMITKPFISLLKQSHWLLIKMEKICQFFWPESGISHIIWVGQIKPLIMETNHEQPIERPGKKQIWE